MKHLKKIVLTGFLAVFVISLHAQDTTRIYYDSDWNELPDDGKAQYMRKLYQKDSLWYVQDYYYRSKKLQMTGSFLDKECEVKNGLFVYYHENGQKSEETTLKNGDREGLMIRYFENGEKEMETMMANDMQHGHTKYYHQNGELSSKGNFEKGMRVGEWDYYDENGEHLATEMFVTSVETPCGCTVNFETDRWIHTNYKTHGERLDNFTIDNFFRKGVFDNKGGELVLSVNMGCVLDVRKSVTITSLEVAKTLAKNFGKKAKETNEIEGIQIDVGDGALVSYKTSEVGRKVNGYVYVVRNGDKVCELFIKIEKGIDQKVIEEVARLIDQLSID